jgi:hypothetical protein
VLGELPGGQPSDEAGGAYQDDVEFAAGPIGHPQHATASRIGCREPGLRVIDHGQPTAT